jgi:N-terminal EH-domain containing protein
MADPNWLSAPESSKKKLTTQSTSTETADRTALISAKLKTIYRNAVLPVEKRYRYDYFFESPLLTDVEFDGKIAFFP